MRDMCESPGSKCASIPLDGNWVNASVQAVSYGRFFPHAVEKQLCDLVCVYFHGNILAWCMCHILLYPQVRILLWYLLCEGG